VPPESKICEGTAYGWPLYIPEASALIVNDCISLSVSADLSVERRERFAQQGRESLLAVQQDCVTAAVGMELKDDEKRRCPLAHYRYPGR
jgi:hypothetical protein